MDVRKRNETTKRNGRRVKTSTRRRFTSLAQTPPIVRFVSLSYVCLVPLEGSNCIQLLNKSVERACKSKKGSCECTSKSDSGSACHFKLPKGLGFSEERILMYVRCHIASARPYLESPQSCTVELTVKHSVCEIISCSIDIQKINDPHKTVLTSWIIFNNSTKELPCV